jgi:hypothetical protein
VDEEYQVVLFASPGPHFFLGVIAQDSTPPECPSLGFASMNGERIMLKGDSEGLEMFDFVGDSSYKLGELLEAFRKATPIDGLGYDFEGNTCIHFASRIWRELGIVESNELGDFLVNNIVEDKNFVQMARRKAGGIAIVATTLFGPEALRGYVENMVYSQLNIEGRNLLQERGDLGATETTFDFSQYGIKRGFDHRHLEGTCKQEMYDVDLVVAGDVMIFLEPTTDAAASGCSAYLLYTTPDSSSQLVKEVIQFKDGIPEQHDVLTKLHGSIITMGSKTLQKAISAYHDASVSPTGHEGESFDLLTNNIGDFVANFFHLLDHVSSHGETVMIAAALTMSNPDIATALRASPSSNNITFAANMTDEELVQWSVEQRTGSMYEEGNE